MKPPGRLICDACWGLLCRAQTPPCHPSLCWVPGQERRPSTYSPPPFPLPLSKSKALLYYPLYSYCRYWAAGEEESWSQTIWLFWLQTKCWSQHTGDCNSRGVPGACLTENFCFIEGFRCILVISKGTFQALKQLPPPPLVGPYTSVWSEWNDFSSEGEACRQFWRHDDRSETLRLSPWASPLLSIGSIWSLPTSPVVFQLPL